PVTPASRRLAKTSLDPSGCRYISAANWVCPANCRAPHICPMIRDVRTWELEDTVNDYASEHSDEFATAVVFKPRFRVPGVDTLYIRDYTQARDRLLKLAAQPQALGKGVVVGTVSSCHGAVSLLRFAAQVAPSPA